jgi:hypothetical protein
MKSTLFICSLTLLFLIMTPAADADIARPKPTVKESRVVLNTVLQIVPDSKISDARLQIPQSELQSLRAALDTAAGNTTLATSINTSSTRTIIAGLLLFASVSLGGVWLARSRGKNGETNRTKKAVTAMLVVMATLGATVITRGNAGPPGYYRWRNLPQSLIEGKAMSGSVTVEIVPDDPNSGSQIKLLIPLRKTTRQGEE